MFQICRPFNRLLFSQFGRCHSFGIFRVVPTSFQHFFFNFVLWNYSEIIELRCLPFCMASWTQCLSICSLSWLWSSKTQFFLPAWWQVEWAVARSPQHLKSFASIYNWEGTFALLSNVMSYFKHTFEENILLNVQLNS